MKEQQKSVTISISIDQDVKKELENYASDMDLTISRLSRNLIYIALDDFKILNPIKLGKQMLPLNIDHFKRSATEYSNFSEFAQNQDEMTKPVQISVIIRQDIKEQMECYAKQLNMPLKMFATNMLYVGLKSINLLNKVGLIKLATAFRNFIRTFRDYESDS